MLTLEEGKFLVKLARQAIETYLTKGEELTAPRVSKKLLEPKGVFVTLTKNDELRGCIGHPIPTLPLVNAVIDAAISSATKDPRFPSVTKEELPVIKVEVSALTPPEVIKVENPREYPKKIKIGKHGLIVEHGINKGLLLPQVPIEWKWDVEDFLSHTCMKAGLMPDCWLQKDTKISRFSAQVFTEKTPGGPVIERPLNEKTYNDG